MSVGLHKTLYSDEKVSRLKNKLHIEKLVFWMEQTRCSDGK